MWTAATIIANVRGCGAGRERGCLVATPNLTAAMGGLAADRSRGCLVATPNLTAGRCTPIEDPRGTAHGEVTLGGPARESP